MDSFQTDWLHLVSLDSLAYMLTIIHIQAIYCWPDQRP